MNKYSDVRKKFTDSPLIDEIVYQCQQILKGIILKDEERALNSETLKSIKEFDMYEAIINGNCYFNMFNYTYDIFLKVPGLSMETALRYATNQLEIPDSIKPTLMKLAKDKWMQNYEESNNYYRMLWGRPDYGEEDIFLSEDEIKYLPDYFDTTKRIHEYTDNEVEILYNTGVIDMLLAKYPERKYLNYLGERSIKPYEARKCAKFGLLYIPSIDSVEILNKFKERFEINRVYILKTVYSEAYHYKSDYYDRFMMLMIILETFNDMIVYSPEYIIDREVFDMRTIQYLFEASGVDFFEDIPLKYQKRLIKNLNRLIKYKSSDKCLVDIISLFGFENMKLFEYYLLKTPILNEDGTYRKNTTEDPKTGKEIIDLERSYKLQFVKVPINEQPDEYLDNPMNLIPYDDITYGDPYWAGVYTKEYVKHQILEREFTLRDSKYMSIDTLYYLTEMQFQMVYFINMLLYSDIDMDDLRVEVPEISMADTIPLVDLMISLYALMYMYNDTVDSIIYNPIQAAAIYGFNFETDLSELASYVVNEGFTLEQVGLDMFKNPKPTGIHTWEKLFETYNDNKSVYEFLIHQMNNANNKHEYDIYKKVFQSLFVTKLNFNYFKKEKVGGKIPDTYTKFLSNKGSVLFKVIDDCSSIVKDSDRRAEISRIINFIVDDIHCYIDKDEFAYIFQFLPTVSADYIRQYLYHILNFFKSYKVDFVSSKTIYKFDSKLENKVNIIDDIIFKYIYNWSDHVDIKDHFKLLTHLNPSSKAGISDEKVFMSIIHWILKHYDDTVMLNEKCILTDKYNLKEYAGIIDDIISELKYVYTWGDRVSIHEHKRTDISLIFKDKIPVDDSIIRTTTIWDPDLGKIELPEEGYISDEEYEAYREKQLNNILMSRREI